MMYLTREMVLEMEVGRQMDRMIGGLVMGLDLVEDTLPQLPKHYYPGYDRTVFTDVPKYSTDIAAAWEVTKSMRKNNWWIVLSSEGESWNAMFYWDPNQTGCEAEAETAPLAICRAALLTTL